MTGLAQPIERLREYLRELKPGSRALLIAELERNLLRGEDFAGADLILSELRRSFREGGSKAPRIGDPARLFFQPLEPFLVDDVPEHRHRGRIARSALEPIWTWIGNTLMPEEVNTYSNQVERALVASDAEKAEQLARAFQDRAAHRMHETLAQATGDDKARRRLGAQLGTSRAIEDVEAVASILSVRDTLTTLGGQLPGHIKSLSGPHLESVKALLDSPLASTPNLFVYALVLVLGRLAAPWQLIRLGTKAAGSDVAARVAETPYGLAVTIVLAEIERMVAELAADLKSGRGVAITALLKDVHDAVRGLRSELDLSNETPWARQLTAMLSESSKVLKAEIEMAPGRVRRLIRVKKDGEPVRLDADEIAEVEMLIGFVAACRNYASELAISEVTQRTFSDLQQTLDGGTQGLLDALRTCSERERPYRQAQIDAAVRFCAKVFGEEYASLLTRAAGVATNDGERKAARA